MSKVLSSLLLHELDELRKLSRGILEPDGLNVRKLVGRVQLARLAYLEDSELGLGVGG